MELIKFDCYSYSYQNEGDDVFGITEVYELNQGAWRRIPAAARAKNESQYRKHAARTERKLKPRPKDEGSFIADYGNDPTSGVSAQILARVPAVAGEGCGVLEGMTVEDGRVVRLPERERQQVHARCNYHFVIDDGVNCFGRPAVVVNSPKETIAVMNGSSTRAAELLDQIVREKLTVRLTGQLEEGRCSPAMIWATPPSDLQ